jgi:hypothetical protein
MGRPVKTVSGVAVFGDYTTGSTGIKVSAYISNLQTDCFIVKQVGATRYLIQDKSAGTQLKCKLVTGVPAAAGEMRMLGYTNPASDISVSIRKLSKRIATDFSGNRYTWTLENDSSEDYIVLTLVNAAD